jgi:16S rRNA (guanine527-N7)-methyltransferase
MNTARIADLLGPFLEHPLSESQLKQISTYIDLLQRWNARINLTAIREEEEIVTRHFGESFFMARHLFPPLPQLPKNCHPERSQDASEASVLAQSKDPDAFRSTPEPQGILPVLPAPRVVDIGSGAGFPAIPLKLWVPSIHLTLVESNHKKATFLRELSRTLTLTDVDINTERAEALAANPSFPRANIVTMRAVERFEAVLPEAITLMAPSATLALLISAPQLSSLKATGLNWRCPIPVPISNVRVLAISAPVKKWEKSTI